MPRSRALPMSETSSGAKYSGKIEMMSTRMSGDRIRVEQARRAGRRRACRLSRSTSGTSAFTNGHETSPPAVARTTSRSWPWWRTSVDLADRLAADGHDGEADELVVVELVGVLGQRDVGRVDDEHGAAELLGGVAVAHALEPQQQDARCASGRPR